MKNTIATMLSENPDSKIAEIDKDYDLIFRGESVVLKAEDYLLVSPLGAIAKVNDYVWQPKDQEFPVPIQIGVLNPIESRLFARSADFATNRARPILPFVLFAWFDDFVEAYIATPDTKSQRHYVWPEEKGNELFTLCFNELDKHDPNVAAQICNFMMAIGAATCGAVADE